MYPHFPEMEPRLDIGQFPTSSSHIHPHPHPLFTRQENMNSNPNPNRSLDPHVLSSHHTVYHTPTSYSNAQDHIHPPASTHAWPLYDHQVSQEYSQPNHGLTSVSYNHNPAGYPSTSPFPATRLSPPPLHVQFKGSSSVSTPATGLNHRPVLAGSLDPTTGIFYRTPEHPRLRTAQACEKCRTRKAKCSGEHPSCKRCLTRGLACEYAKEGRVRGPNKPKPGKNTGNVVSTSKKSNSISNDNPADTSSANLNHFQDAAKLPPRPRAASAHSNSSGSSEHFPDRLLSSTAVRHSLGTSEIEGSISPIFPNDARGNSGPDYRYTRRDSLSMSEHRSSRPRPPDLHLDSTSNLFRLTGGIAEKPSDATAREVSSCMGGLVVSSSFQRQPQQHDHLHHYHSPTRETPFSGDKGDHVTQHPSHHHEFAPQVNQPQILEFQRSGVYVHSHRDAATYNDTGNTEMLNLNNSQMGGDVSEEFLYPAQAEAYVSVSEQNQRFQRPVYERRGSSRECEGTPMAVDEPFVLSTSWFR
ncbi:Citrinin biosynthesis transcriptional activator mrl3 [Psilocybe cubensis]|uniref:Citrinin biosynthesis transcriptional activator mrl3 n=2 Tax=Psilocybe cubensis TaxID=181762 RepID=A0ACB8GK17_PSICU|nr:Citrinin biosynthesis transcriptional activator mrl3 [Psilocybe cubensis]KAH9475742.1 Citrinin biosynthesis transcriptional activator mrl3 [Psilocybe cubensis]